MLLDNNYKKGRGPQMKNMISQITMKELEQIIYRSLQESLSEAMTTILTEMGAIIAENRDKKRFELKDKRGLSFDSKFGQVDLGKIITWIVKLESTFPC